MTQNSADEELKAKLEEIRDKEQKEIDLINKILSHFGDELWDRSCSAIGYDIVMEHTQSMTQTKFT